MKSVTNIFIKIHGINEQISDKPQIYKKLLNGIVTKLHYNILKTAFHKFEPQGFTGVLLLSESHISIHTWPQKNFATLEMITCKPFSTENKEFVIDQIKQALGASKLEVIINK